MFTAQYYGKKDYTGISKVVSLVLSISGIVAILFLLGTVFFSESIMHFLTNEPELIMMGSEYLKYVGVSYLLSAISQVYMTFMKNCNAVNLSTAISSITVILNIMLNAIFIFGLFGFPVFGIRGAALATVLATAVQTVWCVVYVAIKMKRLRIHLLHRDRDLIKNFWGKVAPVLLNELIWGGGFI